MSNGTVPLFSEPLPPRRVLADDGKMKWDASIVRMRVSRVMVSDGDEGGDTVIQGWVIDDDGERRSKGGRDRFDERIRREAIDRAAALGIE